MLTKVLQINTVCNNGSIGRIANGIQDMLIEKEIESYLAYGRGDTPIIGEGIKIGKNIGIYTHVAQTRLFDLHGAGSKKATVELIKTIENICPNVIHLHNIHGYYINYGVLFDYLKSSNVSTVWTFHDMWPITGHCAHIGECMKWISGCNHCPRTRDYPSSFLLDYSAQNWMSKCNAFGGVDRMVLVSPSEWLASNLNRSFLNAYPIKVINNGINLSIFYPRDYRDVREKHGIEDKKFVALGVAANFEVEAKGYRYLIELSHRMGEDCVIILIGVSERQIQNMPDNVIGIRNTNDVNMLAELYSAADVFVNPTLEDNFPTVNLEAMACGTPIVAFATGGIPEQITEKCGFVVPQKDDDALYNAVRWIKKDGKQKYSQACVDTAESKYKQENKCLEYYSLYKSIS